MKKKFSILLIFAVVVSLALAGCGDGEKSSKKKPDTLSKQLRCVTLKDSAGDKVLANLSRKYDINSYSNFKDAEKRIENGSFDVAILPAGMLSKLYGKSKGNLVEVSPITLDGVYVLASGWANDSVKLGTLRGLKINSYGESTTAELILLKSMTEHNLSTYRVSFEYFYNQKDLEEKMKEYGAFCIASEPYATKIYKISGVNRVLNLSEKYNEKEKVSVPSEVLAVSKKLLKESPDDVEVLVKDFEKAVSNTKIKNTKLVFYGQSNRGINILKKFNDSLKHGLPEMFPKGGFPSDFYYER